MWMCVSPKYHIVLNSPFFLWWWEMIKCLCDEMKWGEWHRHCDMVLSYYWPSDNLSEGSSASRPVIMGHWNHGKWNQGKEGTTVYNLEK